MNIILEKIMDEKDKKIEELEALVVKLRNRIRELNRKIDRKNSSLNQMYRDNYEYINWDDEYRD